MNDCLNSNERNSFFQKLKDDYFSYANILKSERPIWKDALNNYFEFISQKIYEMINELSNFNNEQLQQIKNNIEQIYDEKFESLRNEHQFNIFNYNDYSSIVKQKIEIIKEEINKRIQPIIIEYFPPTPYKGNSIVDGLLEIGVDNSYDYRAIIAEKNGIESFRGTPEQNTKMLNKLKEGKLIKP